MPTTTSSGISRDGSPPRSREHKLAEIEPGRLRTQAKTAAAANKLTRFENYATYYHFISALMTPSTATNTATIAAKGPREYSETRHMNHFAVATNNRSGAIVARPIKTLGQQTDRLPTDKEGFRCF